MASDDATGARLSELIQQLRDIGGIDLAAVVGNDGLLLASSAAEGIDAEAVGAVGASGLLVAEALGRELERGGVTQTTLEYEDGLVLLTPLDPDVALLVLARPDANLGRLRLLTRRARGELLRAVSAYVLWPGTTEGSDQQTQPHEAPQSHDE
ncbi:MAG: roadblock/LC7 domain-containing protein [Chloroflexota bacterium]|nr:roadblock/LC7 domain-containing protein [Chloroflexota bacterium]MDQ6907933.1 roadblock/LC7 domain-containing protein [Chloroflexota bacterium]